MSNSASNDSVFSAAMSALQGLLNRGEKAPQQPEIDGVGHRVAVLRVVEGRIIEQSGADDGR